MPDPLPTERELEMLKILWQHGKLTVREIWKMYLEKQPELGYTAVLTLLQYMEKKGMVAHEAVGKAYRYYALRKEKETIADMVRHFVDSVFDGAAEAYVVHALENEAIPGDKLDQLEEKIRQARLRKPTKTPPSKRRKS